MLGKGKTYNRIRNRTSKNDDKIHRTKLYGYWDISIYITSELKNLNPSEDSWHFISKHIRTVNAVVRGSNETEP